MKNLYKIKRLTNGEYKEWILKKHYAKRKCSVSYCFGLILDNKIIGICTFGYPPNYNYNNGKCLYNDYKCLTLELNRYIYLHANKKDKKIMLKHFKVNKLNYPKGLNKNYVCIDIDMNYNVNLFDT